MAEEEVNSNNEVELDPMTEMHVKYDEMKKELDKLKGELDKRDSNMKAVIDTNKRLVGELSRPKAEGPVQPQMSPEEIFVNAFNERMKTFSRKQ